ncbi:AaceriACL051Cp [[Ashbya] aceris (nom. inval.)]|nr:AaceriACL051Cp [[Ashbya] aceris (nom. inval.)]
MGELRQVLKQINESLLQTDAAIDRLQQTYEAGPAADEPVTALAAKSGTEAGSDKVSLLSLKNGSMLAYVSSLLLLVGEKLESREGSTGERGRAGAIEQRVCLERGIKPLEKKLGYQLDKLTRAYARFQKEHADAAERARARSEANEEADSSDESEEEALNYRPNAGALASAGAPAGGRHDERSGAYKPPKIAAALPPQRGQHFEDRFNAQDHKDRSSRSRMQAMDEFIREQADRPEWEVSVGANIVDHGKGGIKSARDHDRDSEMTRFEEENFTRLNSVGNKAEKRKAKQRERFAKVSMIGGEDFSIFSSKRRLEDSTGRKAHKKPRSSWDRAKKKL